MSSLSDQRSHWDLLSDELDAWQADGTIADFWWRDDDATTQGPKLDQLFELTATTGLLLATIPARATPELAHCVLNAPHVRVGQHGYAHTNHAPKGQGTGAWELGLHRGIDAVLADLDRGHELLQQLFEDRFAPVVIPPWNRIDPALFQPIAERGYRGISLFGARSTNQLQPHCVVVNTHCDPIKWKSGPRFTGEAKALGQLISHLRQRRSGEVDAGEPTGVLTHHIDLDQEGWDFCTNLVAAINAHSNTRWCSITELFPEPQ